MMEEDLDPQQFGVTPTLFREWGAPRFGNANPQKLKSSVWEWLVRSKLSAYASRQKINDPSLQEAGPTWSFARFGQSLTELPDGRVIYIAGEHEDFYDMDFYIYNDVTVIHPDGAIDFYCYRKSDFPPTDFHTATLVDDTILILGSLGYRDERNWKETQTYLLRLEDFEIHKLESSGTSPGWIHSHMATLSEDKKSIILTKGKVQKDLGSSLIENIDDWKLNLDDWSWERLTARNWIRFGIRRKDRQYLHLWDIRQALFSLEWHMEDSYRTSMERLEKTLDYRPDAKLLKALYDFPVKHEDLQKDDQEYNLFWTYIDEIRIRFTEEMYCLQVMIEGDLAADKVRSIQEHLIGKLSALVNSACELEEH